ncbi:NAD(P)H-dependent oxidoreductase [Waterburya agarophytonicola K14]|uniref:NAD(P)H-dependent oxidoreductase n=1 Tax=Waterburya agarophytonicola KI4 TaxID=2874699 RepID=A0A964BS59_9CYAN|nr:NAD(P)H-dependent oxidoreductase [Waterburya agarophytonicola]MCC0177256.1 NAD(P)H-dependent oxidoreductase [Waterburya agarophytonicola KI4]
MSDAPLSPEQVLEQLHWRYATKKFDPSKKISDANWKTLEQSLVLSPSSFGLQPWQFFVVRNPEIRQQLLEHSWGQTPVVNASHLVVFAIKKDLNNSDVDRYIARMAEVQQVPIENLAGFSKVVKGFLSNPDFDINHWAAKQVYIALGFFMTCAAMLEIDALPMEGFVPAKYDEVLGLAEKGYQSVVLCPAGYRADDDKYANSPKVRFPTEQIVQYLD